MRVTIKVLFIQLFWLSFVAIGLASLLIIYRLCKQNFAFRKKLIDLNKLDIEVVIFIILCAGFSLFIIPVSISYVFEIQVKYLAYLYLIILIISFIIIYFDRHLVKSYISKKFSKLTNKNLLFILALVLILVAEYLIALSIGGPINDDVPVHLSRNQLFLNSTFTLSDPYVGYNGILDLRYSTNLMNALQALPAYLLGLPAYKIWFYSYAFYSLLLAGSLFSLVKTYLPKKYPKEWPYFILILLPLEANSYLFHYVELPHYIVIAWTCLLFIGLKYLFEYHISFIVLLAAALIATTHAISALGVSLFLAMLIIILLLVKNINKKQLLTLAVAIIILSIPVVANAVFPNVNAKVDGKGQSVGRGLHPREIETNTFGKIVYPKIDLWSGDYYLSNRIIDFPSIIVCTIILAYVLLLKRINRTKLKILMLWLLVFLALEVFNPIYAAVVGYIFLIKISNNINTKITITLSILFFALLAYNPIFLTIIIDKMPLWVIARLQEVNVFAFIAPLLGVFVANMVLVKYWGISGLEKGYNVFIAILIVGCLAYTKFPIHTLRILNEPARLHNSREYKKVEALKSYDAYLRNKIVLTNDEDIRFKMAMATTGDSFGLVYAEQSNQAQNILMRKKCKETIFLDMKFIDVMASRADYIVIDRGKGTDEGVNMIIKHANDKEYLKLVKVIDSDHIYKVLKTDHLDYKKSKYCNIPFGQ